MVSSIGAIGMSFNADKMSVLQADSFADRLSAFPGAFPGVVGELETDEHPQVRIKGKIKAIDRVMKNLDMAASLRIHANHNQIKN